ncbi:MAG: ComEC family competence protein [Bacteroidota bacterium]|nr:ComEC family competence protein [Bacteroidota bacterium]
MSIFAIAFTFIFYQLIESHYLLKHQIPSSRKFHEIVEKDAIVEEHIQGALSDVIILKIPYYGNWIHVKIKLVSPIPDKLFYGDTLVLSANLIQPSNSSSYERFHQKEYLELNHIHFIGYDATIFCIKPVRHSYHIIYLAQKCKDYCLTLIEKSLPNKKNAQLLAGILLGEKQHLDKRIKAQFVDTGTAHILAVSGLHLGMLYGLLRFFFRSSKSPNKNIFQLIIILIIIWFFAFITGLSAAVIRAALMFSVLELGLGIKRYADSVNSIFTSGFIMLCLNPCTLYDIGFQLSFLAVLSIILFNSYVRKLYVSRYRILNKVWETIAVSLSVQFLITPISIYYFHQFPTYFLLANLIWIPLSFVIMISGILLIGIGSLFASMASLIGVICNFELDLGLASFELFEKLPFYVLKEIMLYSEQLVISYFIFFFILLWLSYSNIKHLIIVLILFLFFISSYTLRIIHFSNQHEICMYNIPRKEVIDIRIGRRIFEFCTSVHDPELKYNYRTYHMARKINTDNCSIFERSYMIQDRYLINFSSRDPDTTFEGHRILYMHALNSNIKDESYFCNYQLIILGNTLSKKKKLHLKQIFTELGIPTHDLKTQEALIINTKSKRHETSFI